MGLMRKVLSIATGGLSGRVFKDNAKKPRTAKAAGKAHAQKPAKAKRPAPQASKQAAAKEAGAKQPTAKRQTAKRRKPQAARKPMPQATSAPASAPMGGSANGTINELERLADLYGNGALSTEEFAAAKARILGTGVSAAASGAGGKPFESVEANVAAARRLAEMAVQDRGAAASMHQD